MIRFLADENFNNQIVRGILRQNALGRTVQKLSVGVRGYLPPHNFTVMPQGLSECAAAS